MLSVADLPKAELHVHLEGAVEPDLLREMAPELTAAEIDARYRYTDFPSFIESFKWVNSFLRTPEDYARVARRLGERLREQNVAYAEVILSAGVILWKKQDLPAVFRAARRAMGESGVEVYWIFDAVRQFGAGPAREAFETAAALKEEGVVGIGIGGDESRGPAGWFREEFAWARAQGLRLSAHAGETTTAGSVWEALGIGAERIGHGIRAVHDPRLLAHLRDRDIPLEISISSNVATGAVRSLAAHPIRQLFDAGVPLVLSTDDPAMFHTTLNGEYELARRQFGFSDGELRQLAENSFRYRFTR